MILWGSACIYIIYNYIYIYDYIIIYICYVAKGVLVRPRPAAVFFFQPAAVPSDQIWLSQPVKRDSEGCLATDLKPYRRTRGWDGGSRELTAGPPLHPHILPVTEKDICYVAKGVLVRPRPAAVFFFFSTCSRAFWSNMAVPASEKGLRRLLSNRLEALSSDLPSTRPHLAHWTELSCGTLNLRVGGCGKRQGHQGLKACVKIDPSCGHVLPPPFCDELIQAGSSPISAGSASSSQAVRIKVAVL